MATTQNQQSEAALEKSRQTTMSAFAQVDNSTLLQLTQLTLPEIEAIKEEVAQVFPAGNLPALVLSGLTKLKGRALGTNQVKQDVTALMRGLNLIPKGLYGVFIAGPATALYAYQKLLQLAGKDLASAFPQGTWQFYLQFGLREDTARHANETIGFHQAFPSQATPAASATAWVCAALELLYRYDDLLAADWTERVMLRLLVEEATEPVTTIVTDWNKLRPYHRPSDGSDYVLHRETAFQRFVQQRLEALPATARERFRQRYQARLEEELSDYQEQMTLLAALRPDRYQEYKEPLHLWQAGVAFIWQGHTYLLAACQQDERGSPLCFPSSSPAVAEASPVPLYALPDGKLCDAARRPVRVDRSGRAWYRESGQLVGRLRPPAPEAVHSWIAAILSQALTPPDNALDLLLAESPRSLQAQLREKLPEATQAELAMLRCAPIILNWDMASHKLPLASIRRGQRGIDDHALTIFHTGQSFVFDQSHIFFDGIWGMAVAEILTDSAIHWYRRLEGSSTAPQAPAPIPLALNSTPEVEALAQPQRQRSEAAAESDAADTRGILRLRKRLQQRGVRLTVNDLLLLYRFFHAPWYQPSPSARQALKSFRDQATSPKAKEAYQCIESTLVRFHETNPALLIPMDASNVSPRERIFPTTFRNPLTEIQDCFATTYKCHLDYKTNFDEDHWKAFDKARRELLAYLKAFGELLEAVKAVTMRGESFNTATLQLLGHLPASMQHLLDQIPQRIGILNEIIKGNEVFSNVGRVASGSSLTRFTSAKDDGQTKELVWGILTDDQGQMHISLRDFRPFVPMLLALGETSLADMLAQDYLDSYVKGFNQFVSELGNLIALKAPTED